MSSLSAGLRARGPGGRRPRAISLTPLIDVVFILLVFFMLASSFQKHRTVEMTPPPDGGRAAATRDRDPLVVRVLGADAYGLGGETLTLDALARRLEAPDARKVHIRVTAGAAVQDLVALLDLVAARPGLEAALLAYREPGKEAERP